MFHVRVFNNGNLFDEILTDIELQDIFSCARFERLYKDQFRDLELSFIWGSAPLKR